MRILVVSLLRLGDIIQQISLIKGLKESFPDAELHLLLNGQFKSVEPLINNDIDRFIYFERDLLQKGLGEANYNILWSYTQLENLISSIDGHAYDRVYNFTHNKLSAYLIGAFDIPEKRGLVYKENTFNGLDNRWLKYFNDRFSGNKSSLFHYIEILSRAFAIPIRDLPDSTPKSGKNRSILFQPLTSDPKKNWSLDKFVQLKNRLEAKFGSYEIKILCAPFEVEFLSEHFSCQDLIPCSLIEAKKYLNDAALLVSCDTSIKHLAALTGTQIVEIALGSSDPSKTAAFSKKTAILRGTVDCAPCIHSKPCSQRSRVCEETVTVEKVFAAVCDQINGVKQNNISIHSRFEKAVYTLYFNNIDLADCEKFDSEAEAIVSAFETKEVLSELYLFEEQTRQFTDWAERIAKSLPPKEYFQTKTTLRPSDLGELILCAQELIRSNKDETGYFQYFIEALTRVFNHPVQFYETVMDSLLEIRELLEIRKNLITKLNMLIPRGEFYAKGIGSLFIDSLEKTGNCLSGNCKDSVL